MGNDNLGELFRAKMVRTSVAVVDLSRPSAPREITYGMLDDACDGVARALTNKQGLARGARVGILSSNRVEYLEAIFGAMRAGLVPVPLPAKHPKSALTEIARDAGIRLLFADDAHVDRCPDGIDVVSFDGAYPDFRGDGGSFEAVSPRDGDAALQPYTSGSTGRAKGVLLGHRGQAWLARLVVRLRKLGPTTRMLVATPLYHTVGLLRSKLTLLAGGTLVLQVPFDARDYIEAIGRHRVTHLAGVATTYRLVLAARELLASTDVSTVKAVSVGASPFSESLFDALAKAFPNAELTNDFGLTEAGGMIFGPHPDGLPRPVASPGYPLPGVEMELRPGPDDGELWVRSPALMLGYHDLPEATAQRLQNGWLATGDTFRRDAHGFYYFVSRGDDMFKCGGESVYPAEVEALLERHPGIQQAAVLRSENALKGDVPIAFVVARPGETLQEEDVKQWALANGPAFLHPRRVYVIPELPLTANLKIDKRVLGARLASASSEPVPPITRSQDHTSDLRRP